MDPTDHSTIQGIERPDRKLMTYYVITCLLTGPLFVFFILPAYFRYHTMRYKIGNEGISMRWGILFRREIILNYARIQDIHLSSNVIERWLGLARLQIQTASGSSSAEMTIEGVLEYEALRDFLYSKMRGLKERRRQGGHPEVTGMNGAATLASGGEVSEVVELLRSATRDLRAIREQLTRKEPVDAPVPRQPPDLPSSDA